MKLLQNSSLVHALLVASAAAAPQHAARSQVVDRTTHLEDTVDQIFSAEPGAHQRRDGFGDESNRSSLQATVDNIFAAEKNDVSRRNDGNELWQETQGVHSNGEQQFISHPVFAGVRYACHKGGTSKEVSPGWLKEQVGNKIDYLQHPDNERKEISSEYFPGSKGLDWSGNQDGRDGTNYHDWVWMTLAWDHHGIGDSGARTSELKGILEDGIRLCAKGTDRVRGFAGIWNESGVFYIHAGNYKNKNAEKEAGDRMDRKFQTPKQLTDEEWDDFLRSQAGGDHIDWNPRRQPSVKPA